MMVVNCIAYNDDGSWNETEISSNFNVYLCCTLHAIHQLNNTFFDEHLDNLPEGWNDVTKHKLVDIMKIYKNHIKPEKWEKLETTPNCCKTQCLKSEFRKK
tara:strand:- start:158 stop:460 length:303 start_codon:yes stop_codon:yes gene_type:complete